MEGREGRPDIIESFEGKLGDSVHTNPPPINVVLDDEDVAPLIGTTCVIAALSRRLFERSLQCLILREKVFAGFNVYERIGTLNVGVQADEQWSVLSPEEVAEKLFSHNWEKKAITLF
jgi:hypothetical protein